MISCWNILIFQTFPLLSGNSWGLLQAFLPLLSSPSFSSSLNRVYEQFITLERDKSLLSSHLGKSKRQACHRQSSAFLHILDDLGLNMQAVSVLPKLSRGRYRITNVENVFDEEMPTILETVKTLNWAHLDYFLSGARLRNHEMGLRGVDY